MNHDVWISSDGRREVGVQVHAEGVVVALVDRQAGSTEVGRRLHRFGAKAHKDLQE